MKRPYTRSEEIAVHSLAAYFIRLTRAGDEQCVSFYSTSNSKYYAQAMFFDHLYCLELVSNTFLRGKSKLSAEQISQILLRGWHSPGAHPDIAEHPCRVEGQFPNYFKFFGPDTAHREMAEVIIDALIQIYGVQMTVPAFTLIPRVEDQEAGNTQGFWIKTFEKPNQS